MALNFGGSYSWLKKILIAGVILLIVGSIAVWYIFNEKFTNTSERKADYTVKAIDFIHEFEKGDSLANVKYSEKIIIVNGIVSDVEAADTTTNIKMSEPSTGSYVIFAFQKENQEEAKKIKPGQTVSIKGSCSGGAYSSILETEYITFKRCIVNK
ncbi:MAG: hypothetical protein ABI402_01525 [Ferruginibacter sp.]